MLQSAQQSVDAAQDVPQQKARGSKALLFGVGIVLVLAMAWYVGSTALRAVGFHVGSKAPEQTWNTGKSVRTVAFSPDGQSLAVGLRDGSVQIRHVPDGALLKSFFAHSGEVANVVYSHNGKMIATAGTDNEICLWDSATSSRIFEWSNGTFAARALAFSPDDSLFATNSGAGGIRILDTRNGRQVMALPATPRSSGAGMAFVLALAFSPDGRVLTSATDDNTAQRWAVSSGAQLHSQVGEQRQDLSGTVTTTSLAPGGETTAVTIAGSPDVYVMGVSDSSMGSTQHILQGHRTPVWSMAFSADGQTLATGGGTSLTYESDFMDLTIRLWSTSDGSLQGELDGHTSTIWGLAFSPDGTLLASGGSDQTVRIWKVR